MLEQAAACVRAEAWVPEHYSRTNNTVGLDLRILHTRGSAMGLDMELNLTLLSSPSFPREVFEPLVKQPLRFSRCHLCGKLMSAHNGDECP